MDESDYRRIAMRKQLFFLGTLLVPIMCWAQSIPVVKHKIGPSGEFVYPDPFGQNETRVPEYLFSYNNDNIRYIKTKSLTDVFPLSLVAMQPNRIV